MLTRAIPSRNVAETATPIWPPAALSDPAWSVDAVSAIPMQARITMVE